jgi:hypothetical protein
MCILYSDDIGHRFDAMSAVRDLAPPNRTSTTAGIYRSELIFTHQINDLAESPRFCLFLQVLDFIGFLEKSRL